MSKGTQILVYITADENRVLGGDPLTLLIKDAAEQKKLAAEIARSLRADAVQLQNGDYMLLAKE